MELYDERNPYDPENEQLHLIRKAGLARYTPQTYYDPTYWPFYKRPDNINQTLMVAASRKNKPKSIKLEEFLKKRRNEEREKQLILRQRDLIDEYKIDKKKNWELMKQNDNERFGRWYNATESMLVSYPIKKSLRNPKKMDFKEKKILIKNRLKKQNKNKT